MGWKGKLIFVIVFLLIIGAIFYGISKSMSDDEENEIDIIYREILLDAKDRETGELLVANFSVYNKTQLLASSVTRTDSFVQLNIPLQYIDVLDIKSSVDDYYISKETIAGNKHTILLDRMGNIFVNHTGSLNNTSGTIILNISTYSIIQGISICARWSWNKIDITSDLYSEVKKLNTQLDCEYLGFQWIPQKIEKHWFKSDNITLAHCNIDFVDILLPSRLIGQVDKCYHINRDITKDISFQVSFNYKSYSNNNNEIKFYILDSELDASNKMVFEDLNRRDVGVRDYIYILE